LKIVYKGRARDGGVLIEQLDLDIHSNASVFTRMPSIYNAQSTASVSGSASGSTATVQGSGQSSALLLARMPKQRSCCPHRSTTLPYLRAKP
jgi:hypothetical protein